MTCARCGRPIEEPGLYLAPTSPPGPWVDVCSPKCGNILAGEAITKNAAIQSAADKVLREAHQEHLERREGAA